MNNTPCIIKGKEVTEEALDILNSLNREFISKPVLVQHYEPIRRKDTLMLIMYTCRGLFVYQFGNFSWNIAKDSSFIRGLLAQLQHEGLVESEIIYENKRYYGLTRKGYKECIELIDKHFMLIGKRESALSSLYDGSEYTPLKGGASNIMHRVLSNDIHIALSSLRPIGLPEYTVRHEVAVSDNGRIYIRNYDNDIICDKSKVALRIDILFEFPDNWFYVEQDTGRQSISVLEEKLTNYANILFARSSDLHAQFLIFSVFTGMDVMRVVDKTDNPSGLISPELKKLIKRYGGILVGLVSTNDKINVHQLTAYSEDNLDRMLIYYGSNSSSQIRRMFKLISELPRNTRISAILTESLKIEQQSIIDNDNRTTIERRYINRRETIMKAIYACKDIQPYICGGLTITCVPNVTETADRLKLTLLSSVPYVYRIISSCLKRSWETHKALVYDTITFNKVISVEGAKIIIENISDDLSGRLRIDYMLQNSVSECSAAIICICESPAKALEYVTKHKRAAFANAVTRTDALISNRYKGIVFAYYSTLLEGKFEPVIYISGNDDKYIEYML